MTRAQHHGLTGEDEGKPGRTGASSAELTWLWRTPGLCNGGSEGRVAHVADAVEGLCCGGKQVMPIGPNAPKETDVTIECDSPQNRDMLAESLVFGICILGIL